MSTHGVLGIPGTAAADAGWLVLTENGALLTRVEQSFMADGAEQYLAFEVGLIPGFDSVASGFGDAFEVHLVDSVGRPLVDPWRDGATALLSVQQDGSIHAGAGTVVGIDPNQPLLSVSVDVSQVRFGTTATLAFVLVGGDQGSSSSVRVRDVVLTKDGPIWPGDTGESGDTGEPVDPPDTALPNDTSDPDTGPGGDTQSRDTSVGDTSTHDTSDVGGVPTSDTSDTSDTSEPGTVVISGTGETADSADLGTNDTNDTNPPTDSQEVPDTAGVSDTSMPPTEAEPTGVVPGSYEGGGGCGCTTGGPAGAWWLAALAWMVRRRRSGALAAVIGALCLTMASDALAQELDFDGLPEVLLNAPLPLSGFDEVEVGVMTVPEGQRIQLAIRAGAVNGFELTNRHGRVVADQDDDSLVPVRLMAGQYLVRIRPGGNSTAAIVAFDDAEGAVALDVPVTGTIAVEGAEHALALTSSGGRFAVRSGGAPWRLDNAMGRTVHSDLLGGFDLQPGDYTLTVGGAGFAGDYEVTFATVAGPTGLTLSTPLPGTLLPGEGHSYTYIASAGEQLALSGIPADVRLTVLDPLGAVVIDALGGSPLTMALGDGEHSLELAHEGTVDVPYTISLGPTVLLPPPPLDDQGALVLGVPLLGDVLAPSPGHVAQLVVSTPTTVMFTMQADAWTLRDPWGQVRPVDGPVALGVGTWTVEVVPPSLPSAYRVLVQEVVDEALTVGLGLAAVLPAAEAAHGYGFDLPEAARLRFMPGTSTGGMDWRLEDEDGVVWFDVALDGDVGEGVTLPPGGYRLIVTRDGGGLPSDVRTADFETGFAEQFDEIVQLGDEVQGAFLEPHGFGTYRVVVPDDGTPIQLSIIQTFSFSAGLPSSYVVDISYALVEPYGVVVRPMRNADSGTHSEIWVLDAGTYELQLKTLQANHTDVWLPTEWDLKPRGLANADRDLWFAHDDDVFGIKGPSYGISRVGTRVDGGQLQLGAVEDVWQTNDIWSWLWAPDGDAVVSFNASKGGLQKVDMEIGEPLHELAIGPSYNLQPDPSGLRVWLPGGSTIGEVSLYPFGTVLWHPVVGDDEVGSWTTDGQGRHWYSSAENLDGTIVDAHYGLLDLDTFQTTRQFTVSGGGAITYDPFSDSLIVLGRDVLYQYDPGTLTLLSTLELDPGDTLDDRLVAFSAPTFDGEGRFYVSSGIGRGLITVVDFAASARIGAPSNPIELQHLDRRPVSMAPLVGPGSLCYAAPGITDFEPAYGAHLPAGSQVLVTGTAGVGDVGRPVEAVVVDGLPAVIDASGRFFAPITVGVGPQTVRVEVYDRCGSLDQTLELVGTLDDGAIPRAYTDITHTLSTTFTDTTWNTQTRTLEVEVRATNLGADALRGPLRLVVGPDDERIEFAQADTVGSDGRPAVTLLTAGQTLEPGEELPPTTLSFVNPARLSLRALARWEYAGNQAPQFTSAPVLEAVAGQPWAYDAHAADAEGDPLVYTLEQGPGGATLDATTGRLQWTPTSLDAGLHAVTLAVSDGLGGVGRQSFSLTVRLGVQNQPPMFTSAPPVLLDPGASLIYAATAVDVEGDPLSFTLVAGPSGAAVDPSGLLTWAGTSVEGDVLFTLAVSDGRGGEASQSFVVTVGTGVLASGAPQITSLPPLSAAVGGLYAYIPTATDPEGDALSWWLVEAPSGLGIDPATGRLLWSPSPADVGAHDVELAVTDGTSSTTQRWQVAVADAPPNHSPVFTTAPLLSAVDGQLYTYDADADDPEGASLTYELFSGPAGVRVDAETGLVQWMATGLGDVPFVVKATDPGGAAALQAWSVRVRASNGAPQVFVDAERLVAANADVSVQATAVDPDGDAVTFSLEGSGSYGFAIDATGRITDSQSLAASYLIDVVATDTLGARGVAALAVTVVNDETPPVVEIQLGGPVCADQSSQVCVVAYDELFELRPVTLEVAGASVYLDALDCAEVAWGAPGVPVLLEASAQEASGFSGGLTGFDALEVVPEAGCAEQVPPLVTLSSPVDGARLGSPTDVVAATTGLDVADWRTLVNGVEAASGTGVLPAVLDVFDPTQRENGLFVLAVEVTDTDGVVHSAEATVVVDGAMKLGSYDVAFTDASWTTAITSTSLTRSYSTLRKDEVGDFGHGWELSVDDIRIATNGPLGAGGWGQESCGYGLIFVPICHVSTKPHIAVVTWPGGAVESFDFVPAETSSFAPMVSTAGFEARSGTASTLEAVDATVFTLWGGDLYSDLGFGELYDPQRFLLTDASGVQYLLDTTDGLLQITDRSGNRTLYTDDGIFPELGAGATWTRDGQGRIESLHLADGSTVSYSYDAAGDLVAVTDAEGEVVDFVYDADHRLVSFNDAGHPAAAVLEYDADGRLIGSTDAAGVLVSTGSDTTAWSETTTGPDPSVTTTSFFNADGLVERVVEDVAGVEREASWSYTADYQVATATAPSGSVTTYAYDASLRPIRVEDADGVVVQSTYGAFDDVTALHVDGELVGTWVYDDEGHLLEQRGPDGQARSTMSYDDSGILSTFRDADGVGGEVVLDGAQVASLVLGPAGSPVEVSFTQDGSGRLLSMGAAGSLNATAYDANGLQTELVDANGRVQRWTYDARGLLQSETDKAGLTLSYQYDDASRLEEQTDRNGVTLRYRYDSLGRLERVDGPDTWVAYGYDALGRLVSVENPEQVQSYTWGVDGELLTETSRPVVPGAYPVVTHTYTWTPGGRLASVSNGFGTVSYTHDAQGRVIGQSDSLTGTTTYAWRADGRLDAFTRASGSRTAFSYTAGDRLARTQTVAGSAVLQDDLLEWDLFGLLGAATDQWGRHDYPYDAAGQLVSADHPASSGVPDEAYTYDPLGNRLSWTGHPASEVVYDASDRLVQDADFTYAYDGEGQRVAQEDRSSGHTTTYTWNGFGQLVAMVHPDGSLTSFAYDGLGRRVQVVDRGTATRFAWDGDALRMSFDASNTLQRWESTDLFGELIAFHDATTGQSEDVLANHLGSNQDVPRDSFGNPLVVSTAFAPHALTWHTQDPTGLIFARARYLDPKTGRFLSEDPILSTNRYQYANNSPLVMWDPYGLTAAVEDSSLNRISDASRGALKEIGEEIACMMFEEAAAVALVQPLGTVVSTAACAAMGSRPGKKGGKGKGGGAGCSLFSFEAGTPVSTPAGDVAIEALQVGDRVVAQAVDVEVGTSQPSEPWSSTCHAPTYVAARTLGPAEVLVYAPRSGQWSVAPRSAVGPSTTWWSGGVLHHGPTAVGPVSIEALAFAD